MNGILILFYFFIYSFAGWILEVSYWLIQEGYFINRGFFLGPFCTMYGFGSLIIVKLLSKYKDEPKTVFFLSIILAAILEMITSYLLKRLFNIWLWDYSYSVWNINGTLSIKNLFLFGLISIFLVKYIHPKIKDKTDSLSRNTVILTVSLVTVYFAADFLLTLSAIDRLNLSLTQSIGLPELILARQEILNEIFKNLH